MTEPILIIQDLHKSFGEVQAVKGISLQVAQGELFGLLGPNGAGKTTTLSMLTGLLSPDRGRIIIGGLDLSIHTNRLKARMGLVPQELALYPALSARQNLTFFGRIYGLKGRELRRRVDEVLELIGLTDRADDAVETYSGGMKRRVNIGAGLLHQPDILFLDEPTVGVDPQSRNAILEGIEALNRAGVTILYTTHYMEEAQRLCHRVAIVDEGRIIALDTPIALIRSLGGGLIIVGLRSEMAEMVVDRLRPLPAVQEVQQRDGKLHIRARHTQEALTGLLEVTNHLDVLITALEILEPNLETVFLHLTGKRLRD